MDKAKFDCIVGQNKLTEEEKVLLEPYRVKKAFLFAAGFGSRMMPVTLDTPKPMVRVNGTRIIDTIIDALINADIFDITVVRGYKKEAFDELLTKYPFLHFKDNDDYDTMNNISSAMKVVEEIEDCYIMDSDLIIRNPMVITKYQYSSNILAFKVNKTDDWCVDSKKGIAENYRKGGTNCWRTPILTYWNKSDSENLRRHLKESFKEYNGKNLFWEYIPLVKFSDYYNISIRECKSGDVEEIDNYYELVAIDPTYADYEAKELMK